MNTQSRDGRVAGMQAVADGCCRMASRTDDRDWLNEAIRRASA